MAFNVSLFLLGLNVSVWPSNGSPGGSSPPAWARTGSIADIDFVNNPPRAWTSTGGEVAFADFNTILGGPSDANPDNSTYNPAKVELGVGYGMGAGDLGSATFIADALDVFDFGFSVVLEFVDTVLMEFSEPTLGTDMVATYQTTLSPRLSDQNSGSKVKDAGDVNGSLGAHKMAFTITSGPAYAAVDGVSLVDPENAPATVIDPDTPNQPTDIYFAAAKIKRLTVYNPIKTEAEQRTLTA